MSLEADALLERRRLRRRLTLWRVVGILALILAGVLAIEEFAPQLIVRQDHVARYAVEGIIFEDRRVDKALLEVGKNPNAKALLVHINSPGGTTYGGEALYLALRSVAKSKPVVVVIGTLGASAGYMAAVAGDRIYARESSLTGSIGVLFQGVEISKMLEKIGVASQTVTAGALKDEPSLFRPLSPEGRRLLENMLKETHSWFIGLVAKRRSLPAEKVRAVADGRVLTGRMALENGLIDAYGGEAEARDWLQEVHGIPSDLPVYDVEIGDSLGDLRDVVFGIVRKSVFLERLTLDGLTSVWHPEN
jgi:protease-4